MSVPEDTGEVLRLVPPSVASVWGSVGRLEAALTCRLGHRQRISAEGPPSPNSISNSTRSSHQRALTCSSPLCLLTGWLGGEQEEASFAPVALGEERGARTAGLSPRREVAALRTWLWC